MKIDGYTRLAAVVANPIKHSISPFIHNSAFEATNTNGVYLAWEVDAAELAETVANIRRYPDVWNQSFHALQGTSDSLSGSVERRGLFNWCS